MNKHNSRIIKNELYAYCLTWKVYPYSKQTLRNMDQPLNLLDKGKKTRKQADRQVRIKNGMDKKGAEKEYK